MEKKKYEKPQISVIEVESNGLMLVTLSVGDNTDKALINRRGTLSDAEDNNVFGGEKGNVFGEMDAFNSQE